MSDKPLELFRGEPRLEVLHKWTSKNDGDTVGLAYMDGNRSSAYGINFTKETVLVSFIHYEIAEEIRRLSLRDEARELENAKLCEALTAATQCLQRINDPISDMIDNLPPGSRLDGEAAIRLSNSAYYLKDIAASGLKAAEGYLRLPPDGADEPKSSSGWDEDLEAEFQAFKNSPGYDEFHKLTEDAAQYVEVLEKRELTEEEMKAYVEWVLAGDDLDGTVITKEASEFLDALKQAQTTGEEDEAI